MTAKPDALEELELKALELELLLLIGKTPLKQVLPPLGQVKLVIWVQHERMFT